MTRTDRVARADGPWLVVGEGDRDAMTVSGRWLAIDAPRRVRR